MNKTLDQIRREGLEALQEKLGKSGMIQFMRQFETGKGDYSKERREWVNKTTLEEIQKLASEKAKTRPKPQDGSNTAS